MTKIHCETTVLSGDTQTCKGINSNVFTRGG